MDGSRPPRKTPEDEADEGFWEASVGRTTPGTVKRPNEAPSPASPLRDGAQVAVSVPSGEENDPDVTVVPEQQATFVEGAVEVLDDGREVSNGFSLESTPRETEQTNSVDQTLVGDSANNLPPVAAPSSTSASQIFNLYTSRPRSTSMASIASSAQPGTPRTPATPLSPPIPMRPLDAHDILIEAVESGSAEAVRSALSRGADPRLSRKEVVLQCMLETGDITRDEQKVEDVMAIAIRMGREDLVEILLEAGYDPSTSIEWKIACYHYPWSNWSWTHERWLTPPTLRFPSALDLAVSATAHLWVNLAGARVGLRDPQEWDQVRREVELVPSEKVVAVLLAGGAEVTQTVLERARQTAQGEGADMEQVTPHPAILKLIEEHLARAAERDASGESMESRPPKPQRPRPLNGGRLVTANLAAVLEERERERDRARDRYPHPTSRRRASVIVSVGRPPSSSAISPSALTAGSSAQGRSPSSASNPGDNHPYEHTSLLSHRGGNHGHRSRHPSASPPPLSLPAPEPVPSMPSPPSEMSTESLLASLHAHREHIHRLRGLLASRDAVRAQLEGRLVELERGALEAEIRRIEEGMEAVLGGDRAVKALEKEVQRLRKEVKEKRGTGPNGAGGRHGYAGSVAWWGTDDGRVRESYTPSKGGAEVGRWNGVARGSKGKKVREIMYAVHPHEPPEARAGEMVLGVGDTVLCLFVFEGGWAAGTNKTTCQSGYFPFSCLSPTPPSDLPIVQPLPRTRAPRHVLAADDSDEPHPAPEAVIMPPERPKVPPPERAQGVDGVAHSFPSPALPNLDGLRGTTPLPSWDDVVGRADGDEYEDTESGDDVAPEDQLVDAGESDDRI
ncbi:hypothetical protein M427DRAFT_411575 [Gonapodya prolifera JEL478]|uniref:SH3 domain-containing protein n=1 Tax=Gonapodya prolifera (strain JEL478) TaxID=1344416 RepID=A0A139A5G2_GONPJ|nr:hypothetical protein M427DRAFT_411575 [Gonapodya prolifera JEL478]|eukprot:KXS11971.1 hypothetical protein M427DRAFT_411575 [Gonapodya prolifera JEL478]